MKSPDVIVTVSDKLTILEPQTREVADWLRKNFQADFENVRDQIYVETRKHREIVAALKAAGFTVLT